MATKKKSPAVKSSKPAARKAAPKKAASKKSSPAQSREQKVAASALKLVDDAAALLRKTIHAGADTTESARNKARKQAQQLLTKASGSLGDLLASSTSALASVIKRI
jgi:hypothetical protein